MRGVEDVRLPHATVPQIKQSTGLDAAILWHRPSVHGKEQKLFYEDSFGSISLQNGYARAGSAPKH